MHISEQNDREPFLINSILSYLDPPVDLSYAIKVLE